MGFGFGGEWTAGAVLIGEVIRARATAARSASSSRAGRSAGAVRALYALLFSVLPAEQAWRALFSSASRCWSSRSVAT